MSKGATFERSVCVQLSEWFSYGKRDDLFWRTHGSGARATTRHKKGLQTPGQHGDIAATDSNGKPLIDVLTFSLKRGYKGVSIQDLFDLPPTSKRREFERWIFEAYDSHKSAGSYAWGIIVKRDRRDTLFLAPDYLFQQMKINVLGLMRFRTYNSTEFSFGVIRLSYFFNIKPDQIKDLAADYA